MTSSAIHDYGDIGSEVLQEPYRHPLESSGALDGFKSYDVTPIIGTEFEDVDLVAWLTDPNSDTLLRDLAITSLLG